MSAFFSFISRHKKDIILLHQSVFEWLTNRKTGFEVWIDFLEERSKTEENNLT